MFYKGFKSPSWGGGTIPVCIFRQVPTTRSVFFSPVYVSTSQGPSSFFLMVQDYEMLRYNFNVVDLVDKNVFFYPMWRIFLFIYL